MPKGTISVDKRTSAITFTNTDRCSRVFRQVRPLISGNGPIKPSVLELVVQAQGGGTTAPAVFEVEGIQQSFNYVWTFECPALSMAGGGWWELTHEAQAPLPLKRDYDGEDGPSLNYHSEDLVRSEMELILESELRKRR